MKFSPDVMIRLTDDVDHVYEINEILPNAVRYQEVEKEQSSMYHVRLTTLLNPVVYLR